MGWILCGNGNSYYKMKFVFIGGKNVGVKCLLELERRALIPDVVVAEAAMTDKRGYRVEECLQSHSKIKKYRVYDDLTEEAVANIQRAKPDIIFCIGSRKMLPQIVIGSAKHYCLNIHPALLPKYRGRLSIPWMIFNGEKIGGATLHQMTKDMDGGPIVMQERFKIGVNDTSRIVWDKFDDMAVTLLGRFLDMYSLDRVPDLVIQDEVDSTYCPKGMPPFSWDYDGPKIRRWMLSQTHPPAYPQPILNPLI